jgi:hypothetical protein
MVHCYKYHVFGHYQPPCLFFRTQRFRHWILSKSSGKTYSVGPTGLTNQMVQQTINIHKTMDNVQKRDTYICGCLKAICRSIIGFCVQQYLSPSNCKPTVKITLQLTVSLYGCLGVEHRLGLMTRDFFLFESYCPVHVGGPL